MIRFHHTPDNYVIVEANEKIYSDTDDNFANDCIKAKLNKYPGLKNCEQELYQPELGRHASFSSVGQKTPTIDKKILDSYIAGIDLLLALRNEREEKLKAKLEEERMTIMKDKLAIDDKALKSAKPKSNFFS